MEHGWVRWDGYENFPCLVSNGGPQGADGGSQWKVARPLGATVQWDAETTRRVPGELLAGRGFPGVAIRHTGIVRLERADGGIRLDVTLSSTRLPGRQARGGRPVGANPTQQLDGNLLLR